MRSMLTTVLKHGTAHEKALTDTRSWLGSKTDAVAAAVEDMGSKVGSTLKMALTTLGDTISDSLDAVTSSGRAAARAGGSKAARRPRSPDDAAAPSSPPRRRQRPPRREGTPRRNGPHFSDAGDDMYDSGDDCRGQLHGRRPGGY